MTPDEKRRLERFITAGKIIAGGDEHGWTARLARRLDMNRGYVASVVAGTRPLNEDLERRLSAAIEAWFEETKDNVQKVIRLRIDIDVEVNLGKRFPPDMGDDDV